MTRIALLVSTVVLAMATPALAQKLTVSCEGANLAAYDKGADKPYELLQVRRFVVNVDVSAKTCSVEASEGTYLKGRNEPVAMKSDPKAAKCDLRVTDKGRAFMNGRAHLGGEKAVMTPILTINYEVRKEAPAAGSAEAKGEYFIINGFPSVKAKGGKFETRVKANCVQSKPAS